jgi:endoplasmic reticulum junction formation protein lunapark
VIFLPYQVILCRIGTPQPIQPLRKQWYDKLADALLGDDESPVNAAASRYALICEKCFNHNGLVKESMWEDARES